MDTCIIDTCNMDICIIDSCIIDLCILDVEVKRCWSTLRGSHGLSGRRARGTKSRGLHLEVRARRAPRLLVLNTFPKQPHLKAIDRGWGDTCRGWVVQMPRVLFVFPPPITNTVSQHPNAGKQFRILYRDESGGSVELQGTAGWWRILYGV